MTSAEVMRRARELREDAEVVSTRIVASLNPDEVGALLEKLGLVVEDQQAGAVMMAISLLIAEIAERSPDSEMLQAIIAVMTRRAIECRPDAISVH